MSLISLSDRSILKLGGAQRLSFLQGIITNNVNLLETQPAFFTALLSPQGKFLHDFFMVGAGDHTYIDVHKNQADSLLRLLTMYRLRADVTLETVKDARVYASIEKPTKLHESDVAYQDPRYEKLGFRIISFQERTTEPLELYHQHRLSLAIPDGYYDAILGKSLLLEMGYDALGAIDFHKGCYVGQEVTARSKHRGTLRKVLHHVSCKEGELPKYGTSLLTSHNVDIGDMRSSAKGVGLALIHIEKLQQALSSQDMISADGITPLSISSIDWLNASN